MVLELIPKPGVGFRSVWHDNLMDMTRMLCLHVGCLLYLKSDTGESS